MSKLSLGVGLLAASISTHAIADHWMQTADPQVLQGINELLTVYGGVCQNGNPQGCQAYQYIQQLSGQMLNADYDCKVNGNAQACQSARYAYGQLSQAYAETEQAMARGSVQQPTGGYSGTTHAERMQQIHNWGQQRLEYGRQNQQRMDQNHQQFMEYLRQ